MGRQQLQDPHLRVGQGHRARDPNLAALPGEAGRDPPQLLAEYSFGQQSGQMPSGLFPPEAGGGEVAEVEEGLGERDRDLGRHHLRPLARA